MVRNILNQEHLLHQIIHCSNEQDFQSLLTLVTQEVRSVFKVDRVKIYQFADDESGEVIAESYEEDRLPSLLGLHFPASDIPPAARKQFTPACQSIIIDVTAKRKIVYLQKRNHKNQTFSSEPRYKSVDECHRQYLLAMGVLSSVAMPIFYWEELWGLLVIHHSEPRRFSQAELQTLQLLCLQISLAIAQTTLVTQTHKKKQQEAFFQRIDELLHSHKPEEEVWSTILGESAKMLQADGGRLYFSPELTGDPSRLWTWGKQPDYSALEENEEWTKLMKGTAISSSLTVSSASENENKQSLTVSPYTLEDLASNSPLEAIVTAFQRQSLSSLLFIPLRFHNQWLGCLTLFRQDQERETLWAGHQTEDSRADLPRQSFAAWCEIQRRAGEWTEDTLKLAQSLGIRLYLVATQHRLSHLIHNQASYDLVTQLPNYVLFHQQLSLALANAIHRGEMLGLVLINFKQFKRINEAFGHTVGDYLLKLVTEKVQSSLDEFSASQKLLARWHGSRLIFLISPVNYTDDLIRLCENILSRLQDPFYVQNQTIHLNANIGLAFAPYDGETAETLLKNAEAAMSHARQLGNNAYRLYSSEMNLRTVEQFSLEIDLNKALERQEFLLYYQPQVTLNSDKIVGVEALLRWQHPRLGMISPLQFIPLAEESGLIIPIGEWVLKTACEQHRLWKLAGLPPLKMSVNLSARQFQQEDLVTKIEQILQQSQMRPQDLILEITESTVMENLESTVGVLQQLQKMGVSVALDDFGTGYSSLGALKHFPVSSLKIDRSFVRDLMSDSSSKELLQGIIFLGKAFHLEIVAEGVETQEQLQFLQSIDCDLAQGYLISRPLAVETLPGFISHYETFAKSQGKPLQTQGQGMALSLQKSGKKTVNSPSSQSLVPTITSLPEEVELSLREYTDLKEQILQQTTREKIVMAVAQNIRQSLKIEEILHTTVTEVRHLINADRVFLFRFDENWVGEVVVESVVSPDLSILGEWIDEPCFRNNYVKFYRQGRVRAIADITKAGLAECHLELLQKYQVKANLVLPVIYQNKLWGLMIAHQCYSTREWRQSDIELLSQIATQAAIAIYQGELYSQLQQANLELQKISLIDGLTQVANRRCFDDYLASEWRRLLRSQDTLSLIMGDVDHFKGYNDSYGHQGGDECLQEVAKALKQSVGRPADLVARYGGEEFAVILPNTSLEGAIHIAEKIRQQVKSLNIPHVKSACDAVTVSLGVASLIPSAALSPQALIQSADEALYKAKAGGRDRVCSATG